MLKIIYILIVSLFFSSSIFSKELEILSDIPGDGIEIQNHFKVHVNYRGILEDGTEFDSSYKRKKPFVFQIGLRQVILGWDKGILGMKVGGKRTLKIPPELAYGSSGAGELIPPNATITFDIEILDAFPPSYTNLTSEELIIKKNEGIILIDIRSEKERLTSGIIEGSIEITAFDLQGNLSPNFIKNYQIVAKKNDHVAFISSDGEISAILANGFVEQLGSEHMYSLIGGIKNWIAEKKNLIK